ncbi:hypothetical protein B0H12DRAFT_731886 [Mycena haematopus]|nr:hypothetical protein B0H12DRAFT_731886 [Mycena haematopus]
MHYLETRLRDPGVSTYAGASDPLLLLAVTVALAYSRPLCFLSFLTSFSIPVELELAESAQFSRAQDSMLRVYPRISHWLRDLQTSSVQGSLRHCPRAEKY